MERPRCCLESLILPEARLSFVSSPSPRYYVPGENPWVFIGALAVFLTLSGALTLVLGSHHLGAILLSLGTTSLLAVVAGWFVSAIVAPDVAGFGVAVNRSFRLGMLAFLAAEVLLFGVVWGAYALTPEALVAASPPATIAQLGPVAELLPIAVGAVVLLLSAATVVLAQKPRKHARSRWSSFWLAATLVLGLVFLVMQAPLYAHALGLVSAATVTPHQSLQRLCIGVHGVHVVLGLVLLASLWLRSLRAHRTATQRFALQAVAWYWSFLDASWVALLLLAYLL